MWVAPGAAVIACGSGLVAPLSDDTEAAKEARLSARFTDTADASRTTGSARAEAEAEADDAADADAESPVGGASRSTSTGHRDRRNFAPKTHAMASRRDDGDVDVRAVERFPALEVCVTVRRTPMATSA